LGNRQLLGNLTGTAIRRIILQRIREIPIPLPPLDEQIQIANEVAEKFSQIEAAEVLIEHSLKRAARLRQSILKRAFEGRLVPQDPNDEPADKLLDRIRQERAVVNGSVAARTRQGRTSSQQAGGETHGAAS
jgi:type I restriction enzyme S subunit